MREKLEQLMKEYNVSGDPENVLYVVSDFMKYAAEKTEVEYPYAIKSIEAYEKAAYEVQSIVSDLDQR